MQDNNGHTNALRAGAGGDNVRPAFAPGELRFRNHQESYGAEPLPVAW